jgi:hypothetical protein
MKGRLGRGRDARTIVGEVRFGHRKVFERPPRARAGAASSSGNLTPQTLQSQNRP